MASSPQVEMARFPSGAHARVLLLSETLGDILVVLRGLAGIVPNPLVTCSFLGDQSGKPQSTSAPLRVHLQAAEQSLGVEFTLPIHFRVSINPGALGSFL